MIIFESLDKIASRIDDFIECLNPITFLIQACDLYKLRIYFRLKSLADA